MKKLGLLFILALACLNMDLKAQDVAFSQFYANQLYLNPALAGSARCPRVTLNYRNQWPGIPSTYVTYSASYDQYVDAFYDSFVGFLPVEIIFPSLWGKKEVHASRSISLFLAFPFSRLSSEETSLFAFDGLLSR